MTATLIRRARADYELGRGIHFTTSNLAGWGRQVGAGAGRIIAPETLNPARNWDPVNVLLFGRRGSFKTTITTAICKIYDAAYHDPRWGKWAGIRRVCGNFWMRFAQDRGPLGYKRGLIERDDKVYEGWIPVDPCYADITEDLRKFPAWGTHLLCAIDEWADVLPSHGAMSRNTKDWGSVMRQQRSLFNEFLGSTQKPWQIAQSQILTQIDLLILIKPHKATYSADLLVWDWQGQFTGRFGRQIKFPPQEGTHDWEMGISGLNAVFGDFNTYEIIPPAWVDSATRQSLIQRQAHTRPSWVSPEYAIIEREIMDEPEPEMSTETMAEAAPPAADPAEAALLRLGKRFPYSDARRTLAPILGSQVRSNAQLTEWLEEHGWTVQEENGERIVRR